MKQKLWTPLSPGDWVDIVAPGMTPKAHTVRAIPSFLRKWGLNVRIHKGLLGKDLICSNTREKRLESLSEALHNSESKLIWCLRGGYGSLHLLEGLKKIKRPPIKAFLGLSDITSLHNFFVQNWGWSTLHGCNIDRMALNTSSRAEEKRIHDLLFGKVKEVKFKLKPLNQRAQKIKQLDSTVVGGNLITLQSGFGTPFELKTKGHILFFEDIGERAYRVDRVFEQMRQLRLFDQVPAIVLGQFTGGNEPTGQNLLPAYFKEWAKSLNVAVYSGLPSGHGRNQHPLPFGTQATLRGGAQSSLIVQSGADLN